LRDDIGFQLSFLAILGIIYLYPLGNHLTGRWLDKSKLRHRTKKISQTILDTLNLTLVSQIVILPIALINFQQLSLIAPIANILVLWTFPFLLSSLITAILLSALVPIASALWFLPSYLLLRFIFIASGLLAAPNWAAISVTWFNWYWGAGYYLVLAVILLINNCFKHTHIAL